MRLHAITFWDDDDAVGREMALVRIFVGHTIIVISEASTYRAMGPILTHPRDGRIGTRYERVDPPKADRWTDDQIAEMRAVNPDAEPFEVNRLAKPTPRDLFDYRSTIRDRFKGDAKIDQRDVLPEIAEMREVFERMDDEQWERFKSGEIT
ncbi:hypothetical protein [Maritimibacter sp. DP1N21-5]|uniref:hypothetical protein n=1 Tax=Maritimibacter sp. DP1N21-5 TaxID=2836867 RepID=UPI001C453426|nr:hypothetical protein [Maritimibacter sp. DP1N21-5]MBV7408753.1 hypothetical protein [Maritimibacter sp. DP1N21-5]